MGALVQEHRVREPCPFRDLERSRTCRASHSRRAKSFVPTGPGSCEGPDSAP